MNDKHIDNKQLLILIMSSKAAPIFKNEIDAAYKTWASNLPDSIDVKWYDGENHTMTKIDENDLNHVMCYSGDSLDMTYKKTCEAINFFLRNDAPVHYDYIMRINTSTYINVKLLDILLGKAFFHKQCVYGTDLYSLTEAKCPMPLDLYCRGNCILMSSDMWKKSIITGIPLLYLNVVDDVCIGNSFNTTMIIEHKNYTQHIKGLPHGWYRCVDKQFPNRHQVSTYYGLDNINDYGKCLTIQTKMYRQRSNELNNLMEFHEKFKDVQPDIDGAINYSKDPDVFIGSILGYMPFSEWLKTPKDKLYVFEMQHKASDDKQSPYFRQELYDQLHSLT